MDGANSAGGDGGIGASSNSSDFVSFGKFPRLFLSQIRMLVYILARRCILINSFIRSGNSSSTSRPPIAWAHLNKTVPPRMLEDPSHKDIVRWNETGDSFIVVDVWYGHPELFGTLSNSFYGQTNDFTKKILPNHFKHCNFASFVRQLNKLVPNLCRITKAHSTDISTDMTFTRFEITMRGVEEISIRFLLYPCVLTRASWIGYNFK